MRQIGAQRPRGFAVVPKNYDAAACLSESASMKIRSMNFPKMECIAAASVENSLGEELYIEDSIRRCWLLCLQQSDRHVVNGDARGRSSFHLSVMGVAVQHHVCTMAVYDLRQT